MTRNEGRKDLFNQASIKSNFESNMSSTDRTRAVRTAWGDHSTSFKTINGARTNRDDRDTFFRKR